MSDNSLLRTVPSAEAIYNVPPDRLSVAAGYLLPEARIKRCVETIEAFAGATGHQRIEVEISLPDADPAPEGWYLPLLFFAKEPVAPDLEVRDAGGATVPVPTKLQNMALTERAFAAIAAAEDLTPTPRAAALVRDVIFAEPITARVSRYLLAEELPSMPGSLRGLLAATEDQFVLWVPARGEAGSDHHFLVARSLQARRDPLLLRRARRVSRTVQTAAGPTAIKLRLRTGRRYFDLRLASERALLALGTHIVTFGQETTEARRFSSYHVRVTAPEGFSVRDVLAEGELSDPGPGPAAGPVDLAGRPGVAVQGVGSELGHVHCALADNPSRLSVRIALALRPDLISFWTLAVVLTALLLYLFHRAGVAWIDHRDGALETATTILLIAPSAASALALRAEQGGLVRRSMSVTRTMVYGSALLSISTALVLLFPDSDQTRARLVADFATAAYVFAAIISVTWILGRPSVWTLYRRVLTTPRNNLWALAALGVVMLAIAHLSRPLPDGVTGILLFVAGLAFAGIATNRMPGFRGERPSIFPYLAGLGALVGLIAAGAFAGYYDNLVSATVFREAAGDAGALILVLSLLALGRIALA